MIVGAPTYSNTMNNQGRAFVYLGAATGLSATANWTMDGRQKNAQFGSAVDGAGDVNGDGFGDVLVGAPYSGSAGRTSNGALALYTGSTNGPGTTAAWTATGARNNGTLGYAVARAGDVNGDGVADFLASSAVYDASTGSYTRGVGLEYHGASTDSPARRGEVATVNGEAAAAASAGGLRLTAIREGAGEFTIAFTQSRAADVQIEIFDVRGARIAHLAEGTLSAGSHTVQAQASASSRGAASHGVYFARLTAGAAHATTMVRVAR